MIKHPVARRRWIWWVLGVPATIIVLVGATALLSWRQMEAEATRTSLFDRKGTLISTLQVPSAPGSAEGALDLQLTSSTGLTVTCRLLSPPEGKALPSVILLNGFKQGRAVLNYPAIAEIKEHAVVISMDYPLAWARDLSGWDVPRAMVSFRQAALDAVSAVLLMVDYLETRPDVDKARIILAGASFGAPLAVVAGAIDSRPAGVAALYGGGNLEELLAHNLRKSSRLGRIAMPPGLAGFIGRAIGWALAPLEPNRYAPLISPRPLLLINGVDDELVPRESVMALYRAANAPKDLRWIASPHVRPKQQDLMRTLIQELTQWLRDQRFL